MICKQPRIGAPVPTPARRTTHDLTPDAHAHRWLRFNLVGVAGFAVQMLMLAALERWFAVPAGVAVTLAVLAAVSHNFLWHERVTWPGQPHEGRFRRWLSFNVSTGVVSVVTNLIVTTIVAGATGAPLLVSNVIAVATASLVNFRVSDRAVFNRHTRVGAAPFDRITRGSAICERPRDTSPIGVRRFFVLRAG